MLLCRQRSGTASHVHHAKVLREGRARRCRGACTPHAGEPLLEAVQQRTKERESLLASIPRHDVADWI